jgi:hypothetical protein
MKTRIFASQNSTGARNGARLSTALRALVRRYYFPAGHALRRK